MAICGTASQVRVDPLDVRGQVDELYVLFFRFNPKAALVSCDRQGVTTEELLFRSLTDWNDRVQAAAHARPVSRNVDLATVAQLRFNSHERRRQALFRDLLWTRRELVETDRVELFWEQREALMGGDAIELPDGTELENAYAELGERASDDDLKNDDSNPTHIEANGGTTTTTTTGGDGTGEDRKAGPGGGETAMAGPSRKHPMEPSKDVGTRVASTSKRGSTASAISTTSPAARPPTIPRPPPEPPIRRRVATETLQAEEAILMDSLRELTGHTRTAIRLERQLIRHRKREQARREKETAAPSIPPAQPSIVADASTAAGHTRDPQPGDRLRSLRPASGLPAIVKEDVASTAVRPPLTARASSPTDGRLQLNPLRTAEREFAVLVRNTMASISRNALADQRVRHRLHAELTHDPDELHQQQAMLRRQECSPSRTSVAPPRRPRAQRHDELGAPKPPSSARSGVEAAPRPPTDGLPSSQVARVREQQRREQADGRVEAWEAADERRRERAEAAKRQAELRQMLTAQASDARRDVIARNRERVQRADDARRLAVLNDRDRRRQRAAAAGERLRHQASEGRQQHLQLRAIRERFAEAMQQMQVESQWGVPEDLQGLIQSSQMMVGSATPAEAALLERAPSAGRTGGRPAPLDSDVVAPRPPSGRRGSRTSRH